MEFFPFWPITERTAQRFQGTLPLLSYQRIWPAFNLSSQFRSGVTFIIVQSPYNSLYIGKAAYSRAEFRGVRKAYVALVLGCDMPSCGDSIAAAVAALAPADRSLMNGIWLSVTTGL